MQQVFKIGDLVKPTPAYERERKHTASQCKLGVIIAWNGRGPGGDLYKVYWWPHNTYFFFPPESLELVSRAKVDVANTSLEELAAELQNKAEVI